MEERKTRLDVVQELTTSDKLVRISCSECKTRFIWPNGLILPNFCPNCGVRHVTMLPSS